MHISKGITRWLLLGSAAMCFAGCGGPAPPAATEMICKAFSAYQAGADDEVCRHAGLFLALHGGTQEAGEALYLRALSRHRTGDVAGAIEDLRAALECTRRGDLAGRSYLLLGHLARESDDVAAAEANYLAAVDSLAMADPPAEQALYALAVLMQRQGRWREADRYWDRLCFLFSDGPYALAAGNRVRGRFWTIQAGLFARRDNAERLAASLRSAGQEVRIVPVGAPVRLAVQVGRFHTLESASSAAAAMAIKAGPAVIVPARP